MFSNFFFMSDLNKLRVKSRLFDPPKSLGIHSHAHNISYISHASPVYLSFFSSFIPKPTLSTPCSSSILLFSRQDAVLSHLGSLPSYDFVIFTNGTISFLFRKGGSGILANCSVCGAEAIPSYSSSPVRLNFLLTYAPFCELFTDLGITDKIATYLPFSSPQALTLWSCYAFLFSILLFF